MKRSAAGLFAIAAAAAFLSVPVQAEETYRFGGGPSGGAWHPAGSAGTQVLNERLKGKYQFQYTPSGGSVENVRRVSNGDFDTGWGHIGQIFQAWNGQGQFEKDGPKHDFRIVAKVRAQSQIFAVLADSPIKSFSDMKGKVVNLLSRGSGSNVNCENVMKALGLMDQINARYLGFAASARALGDRQIDVFCSAGVPFHIPALTQLSVSKPVRYIGLTEEEQKKITSAYRFYSPVTIPALKDVQGQNQPARSIAYDVWWMVSKDMSDDAVYSMLNVIADPKTLGQLTKTAAYWKDLSGDFNALVEHKILVHPAAARYWKGRGMSVPQMVVKGY